MEIGKMSVNNRNIDEGLILHSGSGAHASKVRKYF
jgi:hypothetical protein